MEKTYSTKELASLFGFHQEVVRKKLKSGEWKGFKIQTVWRVKESEVRRIMREDKPHSIFV